MISVVICTYNRADALEKCLNSFTKIVYDKEWEIVIVDNNSSDHTQDIMSAFQKEDRLPVQYVFEGKQGLGCARNKGIEKAKFPIIAFTDDDCYPEADFLEKIELNFSDKNVAFLGGRVLLHNPEDLPVTIQTREDFVEYRGRIFFKPGEIHGANFCFRKEVLKKLGGFDPLFGAGAYFPCEDVDMIAEFLWAGYEGKYAPDIVVSHDHGRKTQQEFDKLIHSYLVGRGAYYAKRIFFRKGQRYIYLKHWFYHIRHQSFSVTKTEFRAAYKYLRMMTMRGVRK